MYRAYLDGELLYHPDIKNLGISDTKLALELNKTGSFKFTIRSDNLRYSQLNKMKSIVRVYDDTRRLFRGRILNAKKGFYNELQVTCEGELAFLLDSKLRPYNFSGTPEEYFQYLITEHNKQVDESRQFKIGVCTVTDPNDYITRSDSAYPDTLTTIQEKLIKKLGGYLWTREENDGVYIDYLEDFVTTNAQDIEFGENLLSFEETIKGQDIATALIPLGARIKDEEGNDTGKRVTIESVNSGVDYVCIPEAVEKYGYIYKVVTWDDVTLPSNLLTKATAELSNYIHLKRSFSVSAVDLHALNCDIRSFYIGNYTNVKSKPHDIDECLLTNKIEIDIQNPANGLLTLGDESKTFIDKQVDRNKTIGQVGKRLEVVEKNYEINKEQIERVEDELDIASLNIYSNIEQTAGNVLIKVSEEHYLKDDVNTMLKDANSEYKQSADAIRFELENTVKKVDELSGEVTQSSEKMKYQLDTESFNVQKSGSEMSTQITEDGMRVKKNNINVLVADSKGVDAANLHASTYLIIGQNSRFEDYGGNRTGCFWIGG